jgi:hypothetical protein
MRRVTNEKATGEREDDLAFVIVQDRSLDVRWRATVPVVRE